MFVNILLNLKSSVSEHTYIVADDHVDVVNNKTVEKQTVRFSELQAAIRLSQKNKKNKIFDEEVQNDFYLAYGRKRGQLLHMLCFALLQETMLQSAYELWCLETSS